MDVLHNQLYLRNYVISHNIISHINDIITDNTDPIFNNDFVS